MENTKIMPSMIKGCKDVSHSSIDASQCASPVDHCMCCNKIYYECFGSRPIKFECEHHICEECYYNKTSDAYGVCNKCSGVQMGAPLKGHLTSISIQPLKTCTLHNMDLFKHCLVCMVDRCPGCMQQCISDGHKITDPSNPNTSVIARSKNLNLTEGRINRRCTDNVAKLIESQIINLNLLFKCKEDISSLKHCLGHLKIFILKSLQEVVKSTHIEFSKQIIYLLNPAHEDHKQLPKYSFEDRVEQFTHISACHSANLMHRYNILSFEASNSMRLNIDMQILLKDYNLYFECNSKRLIIRFCSENFPNTPLTHRHLRKYMVTRLCRNVFINLMVDEHSWDIVILLNYIIIMLGASIESLSCILHVEKNYDLAHAILCTLSFTFPNLMGCHIKVVTGRNPPKAINDLLLNKIFFKTLSTAGIFSLYYVTQFTDMPLIGLRGFRDNKLIYTVVLAASAEVNRMLELIPSRLVDNAKNVILKIANFNLNDFTWKERYSSWALLSGRVSFLNCSRSDIIALQIKVGDWLGIFDHNRTTHGIRLQSKPWESVVVRATIHEPGEVFHNLDVVTTTHAQRYYNILVDTVPISEQEKLAWCETSVDGHIDHNDFEDSESESGDESENRDETESMRGRSRDRSRSHGHNAGNERSNHSESILDSINNDDHDDHDAEESYIEHGYFVI
jgi:hypothetical protein